MLINYPCSNNLSAHTSKGERTQGTTEPPASPRHKSHVIRLPEPSTKPQNVAIPTITRQLLKYSQGNYVRHYSGTATLHTPPVWRAPEGTGGLRDDAPGFPTPERRAFLYSSARLCYKHTRPLRPPLTKVAGNLGPLTFHRYRERRGISTIPFQISKGLHGNCMRHFWGTTASGTRQHPPNLGRKLSNHATQTRGSPRAAARSRN